MRTIKLLVLSSLLLLPFCLKAQSNWDEYDIGNIFSLSVPSSLSLRDPDSVEGKFSDNFKKKFALKYGVQSPDWTYTFIPAEGMTSTKYARVIVAVKRQNNLTQKMVKEATAADLQDLKESRIEESKQYGMSMKNVTVKKEIYDGNYAIVTRYDRSGLSGDIHVDDYMFFLLNKQIEITISYRISESSIWKKDLSAIPSTFSF